MTFQQIALLLAADWLAIVVVRFRRSTIAVIAGLSLLAIYTGVALVFGWVRLDDLGLGVPASWLSTIGLSLLWLMLMLVYSLLADRSASRWFPKPPTLDAFRAVQHSTLKLIAGIVFAWILGGILEEVIARGIVLKTIESLLARHTVVPFAAGVAILATAVSAGLMHLYQGPRAVVIVTQLSVLFGILFVVSGYNLWTTILCHGLYDTIGFVRFASEKSRYSNQRPGS